MEHPPDDMLLRFARLEGSRSENRQVVRHLLARCPDCAARIRAAARPRIDPAELDAALDRALETFLRVPHRRDALAKVLSFQPPEGEATPGLRGLEGQDHAR